MFVAYGTPLDVAAAAVLAYRVFQLGLPAIARRGQPAADPLHRSPTRRRARLVAERFASAGLPGESSD